MSEKNGLRSNWKSKNWNFFFAVWIIRALSLRFTNTKVRSDSFSHKDTFTLFGQGKF
jgi:hypothetical protein